MMKTSNKRKRGVVEGEVRERFRCEIKNGRDPSIC